MNLKHVVGVNLQFLPRLELMILIRVFPYGNNTMDSGDDENKRILGMITVTFASKQANFSPL